MTEVVTIPAAKPEASRQAAELDSLRRLIAWGGGSKSFTVVKCNSPALRRELISRLRSEDPRIAVVEIPRGTVDVFGVARERIMETNLSALFVVDMELSVNSMDTHHPTLRSLNASRELWGPRYRCPVVFWLPEFVVALLPQHAPDFWSWVSHQFEFISDNASLPMALLERLEPDYQPDLQLTAEEKRFRIAELEQRIAEAGDNPAPAVIQHVQLWLRELWKLKFRTGPIDDLPALEQRGVTLAADNNEITRWELLSELRKSRDVDWTTHHDAAERIGTILTAAVSTQWPKAIDRLQRGIPLLEIVADALRFAIVNKDVGSVLDIERKHPHEISQIANSANPMNVKLVADAAFLKGDLDASADLNLRSLELAEKLGLEEAAGMAHLNLGVIAMNRGDMRSARYCLRHARDCFHRVGNRLFASLAGSMLAQVPQDPT